MKASAECRRRWEGEVIPVGAELNVINTYDREFGHVGMVHSFANAFRNWFGSTIFALKRIPVLDEQGALFRRGVAEARVGVKDKPAEVKKDDWNCENTVFVEESGRSVSKIHCVSYK